MNFNLPARLAPLLVLPSLVILVITIIIHIAFAIAVYRDAKRLNLRGTGTVFVGHFMWSLVVLFGGVFMAAIYWVMHHSELRRIRPVPGNPGPITWEPPAWQPPEIKSDFRPTGHGPSYEEAFGDDKHGES